MLGELKRQEEGEIGERVKGKTGSLYPALPLPLFPPIFLFSDVRHDIAPPGWFWAWWGEKTGKLRIPIIVGRGAYVHRNTVESRSIGPCSNHIPQVLGGGKYSLPYSVFKWGSVYAASVILSRIRLTVGDAYGARFGAQASLPACESNSD